MVAPTPCYRCSSKLFPTTDRGLGRRTCMVYKPKKVKHYTKAPGNNWHACSACMKVGNGCSIVTDANFRTNISGRRSGSPLSPSATTASKGTADETQPVKANSTTGTIAPVRQFTRTDAWCRRDTQTEEAWQRLKPEKHRLLSHHGYMEGTDAGMAPPKAFERCSSRGQCALGGWNDTARLLSLQTRNSQGVFHGKRQQLESSQQLLDFTRSLHFCKDSRREGARCSKSPRRPY